MILRGCWKEKCTWIFLFVGWTRSVITWLKLNADWHLFDCKIVQKQKPQWSFCWSHKSCAYKKKEKRNWTHAGFGVLTLCTTAQSRLYTVMIHDLMASILQYCYASRFRRVKGVSTIMTNIFTDLIHVKE